MFFRSSAIGGGDSSEGAEADVEQSKDGSPRLVRCINGGSRRFVDVAMYDSVRINHARDSCSVTRTFMRCSEGACSRERERERRSIFLPRLRTSELLHGLQLYLFGIDVH